MCSANLTRVEVHPRLGIHFTFVCYVRRTGMQVVQCSRVLLFLSKIQVRMQGMYPS